MKHFKLWAVLLITIASITTLSAETKRYEIKSGVIEYTITHSGNVMGMNINGKGIAKTVFKEWGNIELHSEEVESNTMGMKKREQQLTKVDNGKFFVVDFEERVIYEYTPETLKNSEYQNFAKTGNEMLESMNGKKIGEENFMGYPCEVWQMMQVKLWLYKGIMLKSEADMMGIKHTTTATKINLDVSISKDDLKLPNFPIKSASGLMMYNGDENENEVPQLTPEQIEQMQEMMKNFSTK
ncbi:hypothetical protein PGH07_09970 [Sulfurovum sp. zt1-1]|uniref:DUF4412 domain-containing protein n=1 Tax=Sulfurovum zhangzhouensis TaxID=3019067 RepID=A0ABT7R075_9BACT|nr:hypothetical protein [Sulfurovum zhangzhouensis]MDM5272505.1 hypothetical protein [Sulfurovum zhangzhouensis]